MGTRFEIALPEASGQLHGPALASAAESALDEIDRWHRLLSRFDPASLVSHINRTAASMAVRLDRETFDLFVAAAAVRRDSAGAFDVTVTPALVRRGFPDSAVPARGASSAGDAVVLDRPRATIAFARRGVSLDLGGIAKGHALDRAADRLREAGVTSALLHGGTSSVLAIGRPPGEAGWRVAIGEGQGAAVVELHDSSLSVSDPHSQRDRSPAPHIVDPRRRPRRTLTSCAVIGPSARLADAWTTALAVLGRTPLSFPRGYSAHFPGSLLR